MRKAGGRATCPATRIRLPSNQSRVQQTPWLAFPVLVRFDLVHEAQRVWSIHAAELSRPRQRPEVALRGWWQSLNHGSKKVAFRAFHLGLERWTVEQPVGVPRIWANSVSVLIDDTFEVAVYAVPEGLHRELVSIAISPDLWISGGYDELSALSLPRPEVIAGRPCLRFMLHSAPKGVFVALWKDLELPVVLKFQFLESENAEVSPYEFEIDSVEPLSDADKDHQAKELEKIGQFGRARRAKLRGSIDAPDERVRQIELSVREVFGTEAVVRVLLFQPDGTFRVSVDVAGDPGFSAILDRAPQDEYPYRSTYGPMLRFGGKYWMFTLDYSHTLAPDYTALLEQRIQHSFDQPT